jgi:hypothetical protein
MFEKINLAGEGQYAATKDHTSKAGAVEFSAYGLVDSLIQ